MVGNYTWHIKELLFNSIDMAKLQSSFTNKRSNFYHTGPGMSIKAKITASMCTNEIRALAATTVDKVNGPVDPKIKNAG